jgi:hypothetical protein
MVLVCGDPAEPVTVFVRARLRNLGIKHQFLDLRVFPRGVDLQWTWEAGYARGWIAGPKWRLELDELAEVYFRNVSIGAARPKNDNVETGRAYPTTREELLTLLNRLKCSVVNRQAAMTSNRSKPFQALVIRRFGLKVPKTLASISRLLRSSQRRALPSLVGSPAQKDTKTFASLGEILASLVAATALCVPGRHSIGDVCFA